MQIIDVQGESVSLTDTILRLNLEPERYVPYHAGQYLQIQCLNEWLSYSIANAPFTSKIYEVHLRHEAANPYHQAILSAITEKRKLNIRLPFGDCTLEKLGKYPLIFIAAGTGFAPIKAMIEYEQIHNPLRSMELLWVIRSAKDLYMEALLQQWQSQLPHFSYACLYSSELMKIQLLNKLQSLHPSDLPRYHFVMAGPFDMVWSIYDALLGIGIQPSQLFSDAFSFPRGEK